jgi:superfamily II DNA or RNA helicase
MRKNAPMNLFMQSWRMIIFDEAHQLRTDRSAISDAMFQMSFKSNTRIGLTATPVFNLAEVSLFFMISSLFL